MSWRRAVGFALVLIVGVIVFRSGCHAPGYDLRGIVRRRFSFRPSGSATRSLQAQPQVAPSTSAAAAPPCSACSPAPFDLPDDDAIDESKVVGTWSPPQPRAVPTPPADCPPDMILVEGEFCPDARQTCVRWMDEGAAFLPQHRCAVFERPSKCASDRVYMRFCVDLDEHGDPSTGLPASDLSWTMALHTCGAEDKRLCTESEWVFACEGEAMLPYPYGFERDSTRCNIDQTELMDGKGKLRDLRRRGAELPRCTSPFGVRNMVGNVDEWVMREGAVYPPFRSALKGGWWMAARNRCRPATTAHDEHYRDTQTGFRCCRDAF